MLVLAKNPEEAFKAPLNTKKQAPVTVGGTRATSEVDRGLGSAQLSTQTDRFSQFQTTSCTEQTVGGREGGGGDSVCVCVCQHLCEAGGGC